MRKVQEDFRWAPFEKLEGICFEEKDFRETLDGGQAFTWRELDASPLGFAAAYEGVFRKTALRAAVDGRPLRSVWLLPRRILRCCPCCWPACRIVKRLRMRRSGRPPC